MTRYVCPECLEIIADGELRGDIESFRACAVRTDTTDLIPFDSVGHEESAVEESGALHHQICCDVEEFDHEEFDHVVDNIMKTAGFVTGVSWCSYEKMLSITPTQISIAVMIGGIFCVASIIGFIGTITSSPIDQQMCLIFICVFVAGIFVLYIGLIDSFKKTWIQFTPDDILFEYAFVRSGKMIRIKRRKTTAVVCKNYHSEKNQSYCDIYMSDGTELQKVISQIESSEAENLKSQIMIILSIDCS